jgi:putative ABC transport system ATP-binding protein
LDTNLFRFVWQHSRGEQILILLIILASLPFYFASLDIPKRIVNDALQGHAFRDGRATATLLEWSFTLPEFLGGAKIVLSPGLELSQVAYLFALSGLFLLLVLINGAFKYSINIRKGILGERMLRRLRFELFALLLRFRPEDVRAVKPPEAASMIKDEVEPIGGFIGDAFIQPFFLGTQALTAMVFIVVQSFWLGLLALVVVLIQAFVIPNLRREQIRLGRMRQIASRHLAGRIGEVVECAPAVHIHGIAAYERAEIGGRLGRLFQIRADLFRRKFAVKYLNNLLAQVTPFFFYAVGGYLALNGSLDLGQLVAVIAAYRDLPPPIKELIDWDQQRADVTVKYEQIVSQFTVERLLPDGEASGDGALVKLEGPLAVDGLRVVDRRGMALLETLTLSIERPCHVALAGVAGSGRDILAKVLGRQISEFEGTVRVGGRNLFELRDEVAGRFLSYAGADPMLFAGTIRDNVACSLRRLRPAEKNAADLTAKERLWRTEAVLSGSPSADAGADWIDYEAAGIRSPEELDTALLHALQVAGMQEEIYRLGLSGRLGPQTDAELASRIIRARSAVRKELSRGNLTQLVEPFDPSRYNSNATVGENLLFGVPLGDRLAESGLASDPYCRAILEAEALVEPLTEIGLRIAETTAEMFAGLPPGHPLFERFSFIRSNEMEEFQRLLDTVQQHEGRAKLSTEGRDRLIGLALRYIEPRHRLSMVDDAFKARVLRARASFRRHLPRDYTDKIEFYEPDKIMTAAPLRDNFLFGRIAFGGSTAEQKVLDVVRGTLADLGLERVIFKLGLDYEVGPGGKLLFGPHRAAINLGRCLVKRPEVFILDGALAGFGGAEAKGLLDRIRKEMAGKTLIATVSDPSEAQGFDRVISFEGARAVLAEPQEVEDPKPAIGAYGFL